MLISQAGHVTRGKAKGDKGDNNKKLNMNENQSKSINRCATKPKRCLHYQL